MIHNLYCQLKYASNNSLVCNNTNVMFELLDRINLKVPFCILETKFT